MTSKITLNLDSLTDIQLREELIPLMDQAIESLDKYHASPCGMCDECDSCDEMESQDWETIDRYIDLSPYSITADDYKRAVLEVRAELVNRTF